MHSRNRERVLRLQTALALKRVLPVETVGDVMSAHLIDNAEQVVSDSDGVLSEAFVQVYCMCLYWIFPSCLKRCPYDINRLVKLKRENVLEKLALTFERRDARCV